MDIKRAQERHADPSQVSQDEDKEMVKNLRKKLEEIMEPLRVRGFYLF
jgi:hypothetical protein